MVAHTIEGDPVNAYEKYIPLQLRRIRPVTTKKFNKVFVIGFHKTGTTSMDQALRRLGFAVTGPTKVTDARFVRGLSQKNFTRLFRIIRHYDCFQDNPYPVLYKELDRNFPNSLFILTVRDVHSWYESNLKFFGSATTPMREWIYTGHGSPAGNENIYKNTYLQHYQEVREYFKNKQDQLLEIAIDDFAWKPICDFLGISNIPNEPFPHANKNPNRI